MKNLNSQSNVLDLQALEAKSATKKEEQLSTVYQSFIVHYFIIVLDVSERIAILLPWADHVSSKQDNK
jgi:hypothetical protein